MLALNAWPAVVGTDRVPWVSTRENQNFQRHVFTYTVALDAWQCVLCRRRARTVQQGTFLQTKNACRGSALPQQIFGRGHRLKYVREAGTHVSGMQWSNL